MSESESVGEEENGQTISIADELRQFVRQVEALGEALPLAANVLDLVRKNQNKELQQFLEESGTLEEETDRSKTFNISPSSFQLLTKRLRTVEKLRIGSETLPRIFVVALVSQFDFFVGRLLRCLYYLRPELLETSDRSLSFSQLVALDSIDAAREFLIEKEVETLLRKSHPEQFDWLEKRFGLTLRKNLDSWAPFVELTQRRNLFVHANGLVSSQYLSVCERQGVNFERVPKLGESLGCTPEYFSVAYDCVFEIAVKLAQVLWRKVAPDALDEADSSMMQVSYDLLMEERYQLATRLLEFGTKELKKHSSDEIKRILVVNCAQAYKWSGDSERCRSLLGELDWSACGPKFRLAVAVLVDDFTDGARIVENIGKDGEVKESDYQHWPLFKEFRESPEFLKAFEGAFGHEFSMPKEHVQDRAK